MSGNDQSELTSSANEGVLDVRTGHPSPFTRRATIGAALLLVLSCATWYPRRQGPLDLRWDSSTHLVLGTSLAEGKGYRLLNEPGAIHAVQYPPLTSAVVALHELALRTTDPLVVATFLKRTWFIGFLFVVAGTGLVLSRFLPVNWAWFGAFLCILNLPTYLNFNQASGEVPFTIASTGFLVAYYSKWSRKAELLASVAAAAAFFARPTGIALLAAWALDALLRKQYWRLATRTLVALASVAAWQGYIHSVESSSEYRSPAYSYQRADYLYANVSYARNLTYKDPYRPELGRVSIPGLLYRFANNLLRSPQRAGEVITSYKGRWQAIDEAFSTFAGFKPLPMVVISAFLYLLGCFALAGICFLLKAGDYLIFAYVVATLIVVSSAPWPAQQVRYLSPLAPLMFLGLFLFIRMIGRMLLAKRPRWNRPWRLASFSLLILIALFDVVDYVQAHTSFFNPEYLSDRSGKKVIYRQLFYGPELQAMDDAVSWIAANGKPGDVVAASMPQWVYLRTGLKSVMPPLEIDSAKANGLLAGVPVRYLIAETTDFFTAPYVDGVVKAFPSEWHLVFTSGIKPVRVYIRVTG